MDSAMLSINTASEYEQAKKMVSEEEGQIPKLVSDLNG